MRKCMIPTPNWYPSPINTTSNIVSSKGVPFGTPFSYARLPLEGAVGGAD